MSNRAERAFAVAELLPVTPEQVEELMAETAQRLASEGGSFSVAVHAAARAVAGRHKTMPGPLLFAAAERLASYA